MLKKKVITMMMLCAVGLLSACAKENKQEEAKAEWKETEEVVVEEVEKGMKNFNYEGYELKWEDDFSGDSLNRDFWNVETHEPGWVNEEWQEYVDSTENIQVKDGKLYLYPIQKQEANGEYSYTSGRVTTQNKEDFTYGLFEARLKVPYGKGFLPAFWLMSTDENIYGQWPRCGEIDIMEVLGDKPKEAHGTIHYGNPHSQSQGTYRLNTIEDFAHGLHIFACEWEPGSIKWYVDGVLFHEEHEWYSTTVGQGTLTYPAPFDQPFYIILNLAVGGTWVGYPDEKTSFEDNPYVIDYVRVYQKESYDENVKLPEAEEVILREPNEDGNYINNGSFAEEEKLDDNKDWKFLLADGGKGTATIGNNTMTIESEQAGNVDYSVQLVQPDIPMQKGSTYEIKFDAYASEPRTFHLAVKAPDRGWIEYFKTTTVELGTTPQTYTYEFKMSDTTDPNGRLEYNMGAAGSTGTIYLSNVSVRKLSDAAAGEVEGKTILADGNFVYNGKFQEGEAHLGFWNIENPCDAKLSVTDFADGRRLKVEVPNGAKEAVVLSQDHLAVVPGKDYIISFEAETDAEKTLVVDACGKEFTQLISAGKNQYTLEIKASDALTTNDFIMKFVDAGTILLDNVRFMESAMIINGSFNAGFAGYEWFCDASADAAYVVDSLTEDNALDVTVKNASDEDWKVQIKQNNITLERGKTYKLTFIAKSSVNRKARVLLQGKENRGWAEYSGDGIIELTSEYQTFTTTFTMEEDTDKEAFLSICLGMVEEEIPAQHRVVIDEISLCEAE